MRRLTKIVTVLLALTLPVFLGCEGPAGPEGDQGPEGPVGPAGEDGSMMYSGEGEPDGDVGDIGDYYLNQNTGELHGPKDDDGWGDPGVVLMGNDGQDGSRIYSGNGEPDEEQGSEGDFYLDGDNYELYGPKTGSGWGTPLNLKGADGNANATRHIFSGHDFSSISFVDLSISGIESEAEMRESAWYVYLVEEFPDNDTAYIHIPGTTSNDQYSVVHVWESDNSEMFISIGLEIL